MHILGRRPAWARVPGPSTGVDIDTPNYKTPWPQLQDSPHPTLYWGIFKNLGKISPATFYMFFCIYIGFRAKGYMGWTDSADGIRFEPVIAQKYCVWGPNLSKIIFGAFFETTCRLSSCLKLPLRNRRPLLKPDTSMYHCHKPRSLNPI